MPPDSQNDLDGFKNEFALKPGLKSLHLPLTETFSRWQGQTRRAISYEIVIMAAGVFISVSCY